MAEVRNSVIVGPVHLTLQKPHAVVELISHIVGLVGGHAAGLDKGRVVAADLGNIAVLSLA